MRLCQCGDWSGTLLVRLRGTHLGGFFRGQQAGGRPEHYLGSAGLAIKWRHECHCLSTVCLQPYNSQMGHWVIGP